MIPYTAETYAAEHPTLVPFIIVGPRPIGPGRWHAYARRTVGPGWRSGKGGEQLAAFLETGIGALCRVVGRAAEVLVS